MAIFRADEEPRVRALLDALERPVELLVGLGREDTPLRAPATSTSAPRREPVATSRRALGPGLLPGRGAAGRLRALPGDRSSPRGRDVGLRYYGLPWGYELGSLVGAVLEAGRRESSLRPGPSRGSGSRPHLAIDVFVTPT